MQLKLGIAQGSILAQSLFNLYLDEALKSKKILRDLIQYGRLKAYADDIAILSKNRAETEKVIKAFGKIGEEYNLQINKKKCEILTLKEDRTEAKEIEGIKI